MHCLHKRPTEADRPEVHPATHLGKRTTCPDVQVYQKEALRVERGF